MFLHELPSIRSHFPINFHSFRSVALVFPYFHSFAQRFQEFQRAHEQTPTSLPSQPFRTPKHMHTYLLKHNSLIWQHPSACPPLICFSLRGGAASQKCASHARCAAHVCTWHPLPFPSLHTLPPPPPPPPPPPHPHLLPTTLLPTLLSPPLPSLQPAGSCILRLRWLVRLRHRACGCGITPGLPGYCMPGCCAPGCGFGWIACCICCIACC